jgi:peptide/nickel transport system ATP-binding protein
MLETRDVSFAYRDGKPIYQHFFLAVAPLERVCLKAPSGFGKTTLCRMLAGYLEPSSGEILCDGSPLPRRGVCPVQLIGQHPEKMVDPRMRMEATLLEAGPIDEALLGRLAVKPEWLTRYPHELSGGELQRFCIARALAARPRYLVADEISTMLDAITQARIWRLLIDEADARGMGIVFVSHSPALTSRVSTRVVELVR